MEGVNRALKNDLLEKIKVFSRNIENISKTDVPCIFISYQRDDESYASEVANYIMEQKIDVYFDLNDEDLRLQRQQNNPKGVTDAICKGLNTADYMLVIVSPQTCQSPWVPFEIGYAYDSQGDNLKVLRHKHLDKSALPTYLRTREIINGTQQLNRFIASIRSSNFLYGSLRKKGEIIKSFSNYAENPLNKYLDNE